MAVDAEFEEAVTRFDDLVRKLKEAWRDLVTVVNRLLRLGGELAGRLRDAFNAIKGKVDEIVRVVGELVTERGSASAIRTAADSWSTEVHHRLATQADLLVSEQLETDNEWSGKAAQRYGEAVTTQRTGLTQLMTVTESMQTLLHEIASALRNYWVALAVAIAVFVTVIVGAAAAGAGVGALAAAIPAGVDFLAAVAVLSANYANTLDEQRGQLLQLETGTALFGNGWPSAVADKFTADDEWRMA